MRRPADFSTFGGFLHPAFTTDVVFRVQFRRDIGLS